MRRKWVQVVVEFEMDEDEETLDSIVSGVENTIQDIDVTANSISADVAGYEDV